ncbi:glycoside hydrolase family 18 chitinase [Phytomonospora endophytica]|uniref:chitinase n=1 Tax=Phytomonospora endophytica TaxID=714109 RepID=A0A841FH32_9ACTN|nr:glycoside hydrolase family 18 chitinase [Phytomonospora endophytica]MBB6035184.1 chitinase [Phytomonospora endophytica]GIG64067.1 chitinase [Phytomonospora endophytica]
MRKTLRGFLLGAVALVVALGAAQPAHAAENLTATYKLGSDWGTGYGADYTIKNTGTTASASWTLKFTLAPGHRISSLWEGTYTVSGQDVTVKNTGWNGAIAPGASVKIGYNASYSGAQAAPTNCTVNGTSCSGGPGPGDDTQAPTTPGNLAAPTATANTVSLQWTASTDNVGVTGYDVFVNNAQSATAPGNATSAVVGGLTANTTYSFKIRARDAKGNVSGFSNTVSKKTLEDGGPGPSSYKKVGYFTQWGIYARGYLVKSMDTTGAAADLTHINYAFGNVSEQGRCFEANQAGVGDAWADYQRKFGAAESVDGVGDVYNQPLAGNFYQLKKLKAKYPHLKVNLSLGGWTWSKYFSNAALPANRVAFVQSCIDLYLKGNLPCIGGEVQCGNGVAYGVFDGIDLDWEWPGSEGNTGNVIRPEDKQNFTALVAEFRRQLDAYGATVGRHFELTAFVPADPAKITAGFEVPALMQNFDFVTVQGYDLYGAWGPQTNHQAQIYSPPGDPSPTKWSGDLAVNEYIARGAPASKLVLGVPAFGRGWAGVPATNNGLYQTSTGAAPGTYEPGIEDYDVLKNRPGTRYTDSAAMAIWLYSNGQFWSYDDVTTMTNKMTYIKGKKLGGAMIWSLDGDDGTLTNAIDLGLR